MDSITATAPADWHDFYVDPFPGHKGSERITDTCGKCIGTGLYTGPTVGTAQRCPRRLDETEESRLKCPRPTRVSTPRVVHRGSS